MDEENKKPVQTDDTPTAVQNKEEEYLNNWKRERADFINYKKDEAKRMEQFLKYAHEDVILEVLEIVDDLELAHQNFAKQNLSGQAGELNKGLDGVIKKFHELFKKYGVERIEVEGKKFDPALHEAVETESGTASAGSSGESREEKIVEVRAGYLMNEKLIRPARVRITK